MDLPTSAADPLAQPTRARLFALLGELRRPAGTDELAAALGLHPNGVRVHLERLAAAGLVERDRVRQERGRPRDSWRISPDARPGGAPPTGYAEIARWLARALAAGTKGPEEVEEAGRQIGRDLAPGDGDAPAEQRLHDVLVTLGFQPRRERGDAGTLRYRLRNCPYRDAVRGRRPVICQLHRGITRGLLDALAPEAELAAFVANDPYEANCLIELGGPLAAQGAAASAPSSPSAGRGGRSGINGSERPARR